jgi:hypothetical protein
VADAICDRLTHRAIRFDLKGESYRKATPEDRNPMRPQRGILRYTCHPNKVNQPGHPRLQCGHHTQETVANSAGTRNLPRCQARQEYLGWVKKNLKMIGFIFDPPRR